MAAPKVHGFGVYTLLSKRVHNGLGHLLRAVPHGIVDYQGLSLGFLLTPFRIGVDDPGWILPPHNPVIRTDHVDFKAHLRDLVYQLEDER